MCVIIDFQPGQMLDFESLKNACHNNWHSFGLITVVNGKLDIKREVPESGEVDAERVQSLLRDDIDHRRFLHLRHTTAGATNLENCQPFEVFFKGGKNSRHIAFMHNGTLYDYKSKVTTSTGSITDDPNGPSDTKNFVDWVVQPYISGTDFGNGKGDISSPYIKRLLNKFWPATGNRGILIANDQEPLLLGDWKKIKDENENDLVVSNTDYFDRVIRGPEDERRKKAEALRKEEEEKTSRPFLPSPNLAGGTAIPFVHLKDLTPSAPLKSQFALTDSLKHIINDYDIYERCHTVNIGYATKDELKELLADKDTALYVCDWVFSDYLSLYNEFQDLEFKIQDLKTERDILRAKHEAATKKIASLMAEKKG